ncbi:MAG: hypothetical protein FWF84_04985, partial [Kiritimatiellaeota bacterium]|nr:hypothetical protein [Kiritimatiellota bacterium]
GVPVFDEAAQRIMGVLSVAVSATGKVSAKYASAPSAAIVFASASWTGIDAEDGALVADMTAKTGHRLVVRLSAEGTLGAAMTHPGDMEAVAIAFAPSPWSAANPAMRYAGYYTVALTPSAKDVTGDEDIIPSGHGYMTLSMGNASALRRGRVTYAGKLPNGVAVSGSTTLMPYAGAAPDDVDAEYDYAQLAFFAKKGKELLSGAMLLQADAAATYRDYPRVVYGAKDADSPNGGDIAKVWWTHAGAIAKDSFDLWYEVYGGYYDKDDDLAAFVAQYEEAYGSGPMTLFLAWPSHAPSEAYGDLTDFPPTGAPLSVTASSLRLQAPAPFTLSFVRSSGIFKGTFKMGFHGKSSVTAKYEGVLLPGWTSCGCDHDILEQPFGLGAYRFPDAILDPATGKKVPVTRGAPIDLSKQ